MSHDNESRGNTVAFLESSMARWFIGTFLVGLLWYCVGSYERARKAREEQEKTNRAVELTREAIRRGEGGEAASRLFREDFEMFQNSERQKIND
jgi:uncharacterized membrane protein